METKIIEQTKSLLEGTGYPHTRTVCFRVPDAKKHLQDGIRYFCKEQAVWSQDYVPIAEWLADNKGRGLLMTGNCGTGKTLIGSRIIPLLLYHYCGRLMAFQYPAQEINNKADKILKNKIIVIDDIGRENLLNSYGNKRWVFPEIVDAAERQGKLLILTTNLDPKHLAEKYDDRTMDRLRALTKIVPFTGKSLRKPKFRNTMI